MVEGWLAVGGWDCKARSPGASRHKSYTIKLPLQGSLVSGQRQTVAIITKVQLWFPAAPNSNIIAHPQIFIAHPTDKLKPSDIRIYSDSRTYKEHTTNPRDNTHASGCRQKLLVRKFTRRLTANLLFCRYEFRIFQCYCYCPVPLRHRGQEIQRLNTVHKLCKFSAGQKAPPRYILP